MTKEEALKLYEENKTIIEKEAKANVLSFSNQIVRIMEAERNFPLNEHLTCLAVFMETWKKEHIVEELEW